VRAALGVRADSDPWGVEDVLVWVMVLAVAGHASAVELAAGTVTCPGEMTVSVQPARAGGGTAWFGSACARCPLAAQCTSSTCTIRIGRYEAELARTTQTPPGPGRPTIGPPGPGWNARSAT
jgi:hypothetical protein